MLKHLHTRREQKTRRSCGGETEYFGREDGRTFVAQFEVRLQKPLECGGAYLKFISAPADGSAFDATTLDNETPYSVMFGPDKCGSESKVHFIFNHRNPLTGEYEQKHLASPPKVPLGEETHLYTLVVRPDNTFNVLIDQESVATGSLLDDFEPPVVPPEQIDDPSDSKPEDWVDEARIPDPSAVKPDDWDEDEPLMIDDDEASMPSDWLEDEPEMIADPDAVRPDDWDEEEDGAWEGKLVPNPRCAAASGCGEWRAPQKRNPLYRGKWAPPLVDNPAYQGEWAPRQIANPDYFVDETPFKFAPIVAAAVEIWTVSPGITFDNIHVGDSEATASRVAEQTWAVKQAEEKRVAAARRAERDAHGNHGGLWTWIMPIVYDANDMVTEHPIAAMVIGVLLGVTIAFSCIRICFPDDDDEPAAAPMVQKRPQPADDADAAADARTDDGASAAAEPKLRKRAAARRDGE